MQVEALKSLIEQQFPQAQVETALDGNMHFRITVISEEFSDKSTVQRHQLVYQCLREYIDTGEIHAVSIYTYTSKEWRAQSDQPGS